MFNSNNKNIIVTKNIKQINIPTISEHNKNYEQYQNTESTQRLS